MGKRGSQGWRRWLVGELSWGRFVRSIAFVYLCVCLSVYYFADRQIFLPQSSSYSDTPEILKVAMADGIKLSGIYLSNPEATLTLLYSHGNSEDLGDIRSTLEQIRQAGFAVFAYDYRGYGTSQGQPSESSSYQDIAQVYHYLRQTLKLSPEQIIVYGRSLGGAISIDLAAHESIGGLIVESTFTKAFRVLLPFPIFPFEKFDSLSKLPRVNAPLFILHGERDRTIPLWHGQQLFAAARQPKQAWWVAGADHNDLVLVAGQQYQQHLQQWRQTQLLSR